jgi:high-affinity nickel-transport protein
VSAVTDRLFDDAGAGMPGKLKLMFALLIAANVAAWAWAWGLFHGQPALMGTALLAWVFGLRHAVDADHIAAIDNVVRKLMQENKRPVGVGLFFSLGHSTVVVVATALIAATTVAMQDRFAEFKQIGGVIGTSVSAFFLLVIALANLVILLGVWKNFRHVRDGGKLDNDSLDLLLSGGGFLARIFRPLFGSVTASWHMYPVGFLFGLGFDTATEIGLLGIAAGQAAQGMAPWQILVFPGLFTAGMALVDTADSALMVGAYGWAFVHPIRKLWYNLTITAISVFVAVLIGGVEALGLIGDKLGLEGGVWSVVADLNENLANFGFAVIGVFIVAWLASAAIYRLKGYDRLANA